MEIIDFSKQNSIINKYMAEMRDKDYQSNRLLFRNNIMRVGELIAYDALSRNESCGGHFREEHQTPEGEAQRDDENYFYVGCWEYQGNDETAPELIKEPLEYEAIKVQTRNYKN